MWSFAHDSDIHFGFAEDVKPRLIKRVHAKSISMQDIDFAIVTGDVTDHGYNGANLNLGCWRYYYGGEHDELSPFISEYVKVIEDQDKPVYVCPGNHDYHKFLKLFHYSPVVNYVKEKHGDEQYTFIHKGVKFICCGKYPKDVKWLRKQLTDVKQPTFIFFHYNLAGPYSDWWSNKEKDEFYDCIKDFNIIALLVGHHHISATSEWRGFHVISSANQYSIITYNSYTQDIDVSYY
jgi:3',5'-cyclic AMP phosphodiesterase CpdA